MNVRDIVYNSNGMTVAFDDNSVAHVVYKVVNDQLTLIGLNDAQRQALQNFNSSQRTNSTIDDDLRFTSVDFITETITLSGGSSGNGASQRIFFDGFTNTRFYKTTASGYIRAANYHIGPRGATLPNDAVVTMRLDVGGSEVWQQTTNGDGTDSILHYYKKFAPGTVPVEQGTIIQPYEDNSNNANGTYTSLHLNIVYYL